MSQKHFEFADFVQEFKVQFNALVENPGQYGTNGKWKPGSPGVPIAMEGIILPLSEDEIRFNANGSYTEKDRKLYLTEPLEIGQRIEYKGQEYTVDREKPYSDYADVYIYYCKGVTK